MNSDMAARRIGIITAIVALDSTAQVSVIGEDVTWHDGNPNGITTEQITAKEAELQTAYDAKAYSRTRADAYPSIGDQLDALFHADVFPDDMAATLQAVKDANPKP